MDVFIYILSDPRTKEIRYVGKAVDATLRLAVHLANSQRERNHKANWIKSLAKDGLKPEMEIVESLYETSDAEWQIQEKWWISYLRFIGCRLTNLTAGGEGCAGLRPSADTREKMSAWQRGRKMGPLSAEHKAKISARHKGKPSPKSAEHRARISATLLGRPLSEQCRKSISEAHKTSEAMKAHLRDMSNARIGVKLPPRSPEHCARISAAKKGKSPSEETRKNMAEAHRNSSATKAQISRLADINKKRHAKRRAQLAETH